jgi:predicted dehydrogenase
LRIGIIGLGNIGRVHAKNIQDGLVGGAKLCAVANQPIETLDDFKLQGIACFDDANKLIDSGEVDTVIVALPSALHAPIGIRAIEAGLHVMIEKPLARHKAEGERILAARQREDQVIALMMNQRTHPCYVQIKAWINEGAIGALQRVSWTTTDWFRPEVYFQSSPWRATWQGEGGGALMNQCTHNLDMLQWLAGMPSKVRAHCSFGKYHDIEVEDEVTAYLEYANGATGQFVASTGEYPGINRLEIVGDLGTIITDSKDVKLIRASESVAKYSKTTDEMFGSPKRQTEIHSFTAKINQHAIVLDNFVKAIRGEAELIADASEGIYALELAGAMIYSSWMDATVELPLDAAATKTCCRNGLPFQSRVK